MTLERMQMPDYTDFADRLRRIIIPDVPMTSMGQWMLHRYLVDKMHLFLLIPLKARMMEQTKGMTDDEIRDVYSKILEFFGERYSETGMVKPPSKIDGPQDMKLNYATSDQFYLNMEAVYYTHHFIRLRNGASVNFVIVPSKDGDPSGANRTKNRRYIFFDFNAAPNDEKHEKDLPLSPIEEWGDDLFVYFQYRIDETKLAQGKYNDETERKVRDFIGKDRKFAELFSKPNNGSKTLFRQELNKYTSHIRTGVNEKYVHKNLQAHLMKELDEFIKKRLLDLDFILGKVKGK